MAPRESVREVNASEPQAGRLTPVEGWPPGVVGAPSRRETAILRLQRTHGNRQVRRMLEERAQGNGPNGPTSTPPDTQAVRVPAVARVRARSPKTGQAHRQPATANRPAPDIRFPEQFPTYEGWLEAFHSSFLATPALRQQHTFTSHDTVPGGTSTGQTVLGQKAGSLQEAPSRVSPMRADRFIDHPTDTWVRNNLPERLLETAYQLPSDCADMAVILRHVWLASHGRTETYRGWTIGFHPGGRRAEQRRVHGAIRALFTGNIASMVNPYSDADGRPIRRFSILQHMLHPGDILVWQHHSDPKRPTRRTGGHTHTISHIDRDDQGNIREMTLLQGNQPIFRTQALEIQAQERAAGRPVPGEMELRNAPGRRIEVSTMRASDTGGDLLGISDLEDSPEPRRPGSAGPQEMVWTWVDGHTRLVAAGPPASARRPPAQRRRGERRARRRITDWLPRLRSATDTSLQGRFEAALIEARAMLEGGQQASQPPVSEADARLLGQTAGERVWRLARRAAQRGGRSTARRRAALADEVHFRRIQQYRAVIRSLKEAGLNDQVRTIFTAIDEAFVTGARGASSVSFARSGVGRRQLVKVLLTGFDPFDPSRGGGPAPGSWNPSGAAVLALDGTRLNMRGKVVAVEGIVLPVSFSDFGAGMVERFVRPHLGDADAVITVSMSPNITPGQPVRIERFAVNAHTVQQGVPSAISGVGPAVIESNAPIQDIARETAQPQRGRRPAIPEPTIGEDITFKFATVRQANAVRTALGQTPVQPSPSGLANPFETEVTMTAAQWTQIAPTVQQQPGGRGLAIRFQLGGQTHQGEVISGPGGNFLSNEVSYRVLSMIQSVAGTQKPMSFHVHTQEGSPVPPRPSDAAGRAALDEAMRVRNTLIATLRRMIRAVARRAGQGGGP